MYNGKGRTQSFQERKATFAAGMESMESMFYGYNLNPAR